MNTIENLYILGAGASFDAGAPVMTNFIDVAEDLLVAKKFRNQDELEKLFSKMKSLNSLHAKSKIDLNNIESMLGLFEMSELLEYSLDDENAEFKSLKTSYIKMIAETIEQSMQFNIVNPKKITPLGSYNSFVLKLKNNNKINSSAIISFNYDLGVDVSLHNNNIPYSYYLDDSSTGFPLLKLHGSLNWFKNRTDTIHPFSLNNFFLGREFQTFDESNPKGILSFSEYIKDVNMSDVFNHYSTIPFIIPPTWNKTMYHKSIGNVWRKASQCLAEAKNIYVIGYSLPETDAFFKFLFSLGTNSQTRVRKFCVINPDSNTVNRYKHLLGPQILDRFKYFNYNFQRALLEKSIWE